MTGVPGTGNHENHLVNLTMQRADARITELQKLRIIYAYKAKQAKTKDTKAYFTIKVNKIDRTIKNLQDRKEMLEEITMLD